ncbi:MAG: lactate utilization protein [Chloroflexota bacterium]
MAKENDFQDVGRWHYDNGVRLDWEVPPERKTDYEKHIRGVMEGYYRERLKVEGELGEVAVAHYEHLSKIIIDNLRKRNMEGYYAADRRAARDLILGMIPEGAAVSRGDSMTMDAIGVVSALVERNQNAVSDPFVRKADGSPLVKVMTEPWYDMHRQAFHADVFLTGTNAITLDGKLVNIDGVGNRVAPMVFGPKKVIIAVGVNKIVKDTEEALARIHEYAAPVNARRHAMLHGHTDYASIPCAATGKCVDCRHEWRLCRATTIIEGSFLPLKGRIHVVIVGEELGI